MKSAAAKRAANPGVLAVTVTYNASSAPTFRSQIARSTQIWNSSVRNVKLQEGSNADFRYYEATTPAAPTRAPTATGGATSSSTTGRTSSTTPPV